MKQSSLTNTKCYCNYCSNSLQRLNCPVTCCIVFSAMTFKNISPQAPSAEMDAGMGDCKLVCCLKAMKKLSACEPESKP